MPWFISLGGRPLKSCLTPVSKSTSTPSRSQKILYPDDVVSSVDELREAVAKKPERDACVFAFFLDCSCAGEFDGRFDILVIDISRRGGFSLLRAVSPWWVWSANRNAQDLGEAGPDRQGGKNGVSLFLTESYILQSKEDRGGCNVEYRW